MIFDLYFSNFLFFFAYLAIGIAIGFIAHVVIHLLAGRGQEINAGTWVITLFGMLWLATPFLGT